MFERGKPVFSFEVFPPNKSSTIDTIYSTLEQLAPLRPDFISVTYGAGGSEAQNKTCQIAALIKSAHKIEPLAHLTCINHTAKELDGILGELKANQIENILALRGDVKADLQPPKELIYASELTELIKMKEGFHVSGACYPEGHLDSKSLTEDIFNLKKKVDAGAEHLISQLFFENEKFINFVEKCTLAGINIPIQAGIMPVVNKKQIERIVSLCGASLPAKFTKIMQRYEHSPEALRDAGIAYATEQIVDLLAQGVAGIHLYTMNNPFIAKKISENIKNLINP